MFGLLSWLASFLLRRRPSLTQVHADRLAKVIAGAALVIAVIAGFALWLTLHDRKVVEEHQLQTRAATAETSLARDREATTNAAVREQARQDRSTATQKAMTDAEAADPEAAARPAGRVSRAAADRLRRDPAAVDAAR